MSINKCTAFEQWFGDSKVVDEAGAPLAVYHGTTTKFTFFDIEKAYYKAAFFTPDRDVAKMFAEGKKGVIHTVFLAIRNPKIIDADAVGRWTDPEEDEDGRTQFMHDTHEKRLQIELAMHEGFDGMLIRNLPEDDLESDQWIAFKPEQIKSSTCHNGDFDVANPDIRFSLVDADDEIGTEAPCP